MHTILVDGLSCARKIRDLESEGTIVRHVPIIAVTANARLEQIETAISAGMVCIKANREVLEAKKANT
jgi:CheY-like chemotaxis protein